MWRACYCASRLKSSGSRHNGEKCCKCKECGDVSCCSISLGHMSEVTWEKFNIYMNKECGEVFSNSYVTDQRDPTLTKSYLPRG